MDAPPVTHSTNVLPGSGSEKGVFARILAGLAAEHGERKTVMIDASYVKAHRTESSLGVKKGAWPPDWQNQRRHEYKAARYL